MGVFPLYVLFGELALAAAAWGGRPAGPRGGGTRWALSVVYPSLLLQLLWGREVTMICARVDVARGAFAVFPF